MLKGICYTVPGAIGPFPMNCNFNYSNKTFHEFIKFNSTKSLLHTYLGGMPSIMPSKRITMSTTYHNATKLSIS